MNDKQLAEKVAEYLGKGKRKWEIFWRDRGVSFCLPTQEWSADPADPEWEFETEFYSMIDNGYHKAISLAFIEAMEIIGRGKDD